MKKFKSRMSMLMLPLAFVFAGVISSCDDDDEPKPIAAPTLNNASEITHNSFKATWTAVPSADEYLLDVSEDEDFETFLEGYEKKEIEATTAVVGGLDAETTYYFRVYTKKGSRTSAASVVKEVTTLEDEVD